VVTHQLQVERRTGKVRRSKTDVLPTVPRNQSVYQIDMKFVRQLRPATETSWVVSYGGETIQRWRTAAILKIDISPYLSEKSSDFDEIFYTAADFEQDERHVIKNEKKLY